MNGDWQFVVHQQALESMEAMRAAERQRVRKALRELINDPFQRPDMEQRSPRERTCFIKVVGPFRIRYWLDDFVKEVRIVSIEPSVT